jgi:hypothetical protein
MHIRNWPPIGSWFWVRGEPPPEIGLSAPVPSVTTGARTRRGASSGSVNGTVVRAPLIPLPSRSDPSGTRPAEPFTVATPAPVNATVPRLDWTKSSVSVPS